ncbi:MAG: hypothetical protein JNL57_13480 [Bacteroidetes bacterium]|nr:hypothetical protein [Bacteroidota bacterium]
MLLIVFVWGMVIRIILKQKKTLFVSLVLPNHAIAAGYKVYGIKYESTYHRTYTGAVSNTQIYHTDRELSEAKVRLGRTNESGIFRRTFYLSNYHTFIFQSPEGKQTVRNAGSLIQSSDADVRPVVVYLDYE